jgi:hypothetical protein
MGKRSALRLCQKALQIRHAKDICFEEVKCGSHVMNGGVPRIDFIAVAKSWANLCITGYEVKVDRSDFLRDAKWDSYLPYVHRFYFACPKGLIQPTEVPDPAGLVWCTEKGARVMKATAHNPVSVSWELLYYLVLWRSDEERAWRSRRERSAELLSEWLEKKKGFESLGYRVGERIREKIEDLARREREILKREQAVEQATKQREQLEELAGACGVDIWSFEYMLRDLKHMAEVKLTDEARQRAQRTREQLDRLAAIGTDADASRC